MATTPRMLTGIWRGDTTWSQALGSGDAVVTGSSGVRRSVPEWIGQSLLSAVPLP